MWRVIERSEEEDTPTLFLKKFDPLGFALRDGEGARSSADVVVASDFYPDSPKVLPLNAEAY